MSMKFYDDDGAEINADPIPKPDLCITCTRDDIRKFRSILEQAVHGNAIADLEGNLLHLNKAFAEIHGYEPDELLGKNLSVFHTKEQMVDVNRINGGTRKLENYGHKWANFQTQFFQINSQPFYVLLSSNGKQILNQPVAYTPNEEDYIKFLQCGLEVFHQLK